MALSTLSSNKEFHHFLGFLFFQTVGLSSNYETSAVAASRSQDTGSTCDGAKCISSLVHCQRPADGLRTANEAQDSLHKNWHRQPGCLAKDEDTVDCL